MFEKFSKLTKNLPAYESGFKSIFILSSNEKTFVLNFSQNNFAYAYGESWLVKM